MSIRDQKLPFMFEYWPTGAAAPQKTFVLPINPESYRIRHNAKVSITQTRGGTFTDSFGKGIAQISISGTFGLLGSLKGGPGIHAEGKNKDAWNLLKEFEADVFFEFYAQFGADQNPTQGLKPQLRFYNFTDEHFYEVILNPFTVTRSTQRRHLYQYQIEMQCIRDLTEPSQQSQDILVLLNEVEAPNAEEFSRWSKIMEAYTSVSVKVSDAINTMQSIQASIERISASVWAFRNGITSLIAAPFELVESAIRGIDSIIESVVSLKDIPHEFIDHLRGVKRALLTSRINKHLFSDKDENPEVVTSTAEEILTAPIPTRNTTGVELTDGENPESTLFAPGIEQTTNLSATVESVNDADTIESLAARTLGDANLWRRIAFLNDLEPPFIAQSVSEGFSETAEESTVTEVVGRRLYAQITPPTEGQVIIFHDGESWEAIDVETYDTFQANTVLVTYPEKTYAPGTKITVHERRLNVAWPGDRIKIPSDNTNPAPTLGAYQDHYDRIFGADEYLDKNGNQAPDNSGDISVIVGLKNLEMQLQHRLQTLRGELAVLGHPTYGSLLPALIGKANTDYWIERIRFEAKASVLEDPRIRSVESLDLAIENDCIKISAMVRTAGLDGERQISLLI